MRNWVCQICLITILSGTVSAGTISYNFTGTVTGNSYGNLAEETVAELNTSTSPGFSGVFSFEDSTPDSDVATDIGVFNSAGTLSITFDSGFAFETTANSLDVNLLPFGWHLT